MTASAEKSKMVRDVSNTSLSLVGEGSTSGTPTLPSGWRWLTVGEMAENVQYGTSAKTGADEKGVPVIRMGNIQEGSLLLDSLKYLPAAHEEFPELLLRDGDLLFNRTNSSELVGKSAVYRGNPPQASFASYLIRAQLKPEYVPEFLAYYINSPHGRQWVSSVVSQQVGQANVNGTKLKALRVPVPPLSEQRRIVTEIEQQFTRLDAGVAALRRTQANLKRYRAAVLNLACEGRLVSTEVELAKYQNRKVKVETGDTLLARIFATAEVSPLGKAKLKPLEISLDSIAMPVGWTDAPLERLAEVVDPNPKHRNPTYVEKGFPFLSTAQFGKGKGFDLTTAKTVTLETVLEQEARCHFSSRSIAFSRKGTIGKTRFVPTDHRFALLDSLCVINASPEISADYLNVALNSAFVQRQVWQKVRGVALKQISVGGVRELRIPIPPLAEQIRIVAEVDRRLSVVDELESVVTTNLQRANRLRQSILQQAFSGL